MRRSNYQPKDGFIDWGLYTVIFFVIELPFIEYGWMKLLSVAIIIGFFAGALNRFVREYYDHIAFLEEKEKQSTINRVTGEQPVWSNRTLRGPHEIDERPQGQRDPNQEK